MFAFQKHTAKLASEVPKCKTEMGFKVTRGRGLHHLDGTVQVYSATLQDQVEIPACFISAVFPTPPCSELTVSPGMYRSLYKKDYRWCEKYKPPGEEDVQKLQVADSQLRAKEFAVPREERAMTYSDRVGWQGREVTPPPSVRAGSRADDAGGRRPGGSASGPGALQQRKHFASVLPAAEGYPPKHGPATQRAASQAEGTERPQALTELENRLSCWQRHPAAAPAAGTAGTLLRRQKLAPVLATYQQFTLEACRARQQDAQQNRSMNLGSSVLVDECFDLDWRSTYNTDFQRWPGAHGGYCRANKNFSHIFPEDEHLKQNRWISEYEDNYSVFLWRLHWSSQTPAAGLCSGLPFGKGIAMGTAQ